MPLRVYDFGLQIFYVSSSSSSTNFSNLLVFLPLCSNALVFFSSFFSSNGAIYRGGSPLACTLHAVAASLHLQRPALRCSGVRTVQAPYRFDFGEVKVRFGP